MQVIALRGLLFETADTDELNYRKRLRDATLQAIGSSRFAIYHHVVRRRVETSLAPSLSRVITPMDGVKLGEGNTVELAKPVELEPSVICVTGPVVAFGPRSVMA